MAVGPGKPISITTKDHREYSMFVAPVKHNDDWPKKLNRLNKYQAIAIAYPSLHDTIEIHPNNKFSLDIHTFLNYTAVYDDESKMQAAIPDLKVSLREAVKKLIDYSDRNLQIYHQIYWHNIWSSGFSISYSHAPNAINSYLINATLYYMISQRELVLTNQDHILLELDKDLLNFVNVIKNNSSIYRPDRCYHGHSTFHVILVFYFYFKF